MPMNREPPRSVSIPPRVIEVIRQQGESSDYRTLACLRGMAAIADQRLNVQPGSEFVETAKTKETLRRALTYLNCGYAVNFCGPAGTGKTTLARHAAHLIGRPVLMLAGDEEITSLSMIGGYRGVRHKRVDDNYIRSVHKTQDEFVELWVDNRLTVACQEGYTLVYDEFTRSRPETNSVLLSVLEERILHMPIERGVGRYLPVHPDFRLILTSNPLEYAGVFHVPDALRDRTVRIYLDRYDADTEIDIVCSKTGLDRADAEVIVYLVRSMDADERLAIHPSLRASIMLGRVLKSLDLRPNEDSTRVFPFVLDILGPGTDERELARAIAADLLRQNGSHAPRPATDAGVDRPSRRTGRPRT